MKDLQNLTAADLQAFSTRLFSYYQEINQHLDQIERISQSVTSELNPLKDSIAILKKESNVVAGALEIIQIEFEKRIKKNLRLTLNTEAINNEISSSYNFIKELNRSKIEDAKNLKNQL